ncbi:MAG: UDP-N-acetylmuramoyl-tripeptide--D-alanyl-D-alanine ligase [Caldimicrobium sp.]
MLVNTPFSTEDIVKALRGILVNGDMGIAFKGICTDTRILEPGYLFWALKGKRFDGHTFWIEAIAKGAKGLILEYFPSEMKLEELPKTISIILVRDTLQALGELAKWYREQKKFKVIGITGSCGKTTTKELTATLLSQFFRVAKNEANYNNLIGVPLSILQIKEKPDWVVLELGTNAPNEIKKLAEIISPQISLITCVYPAHLEGLGSLEGVLEEKLSLFKATPEEGALIYFYDQPWLREKVSAFPHKKISYGKELGADLRLIMLKSLDEGFWAEIEYSGKRYHFRTNPMGEHNLLNLLGAIATCLSLGISLEEVLKVLPEDLSLFVRGKLYKKGEVHILDDSYNANPGSMEKALLWLGDFTQAVKPKVVILGDMKELGEETRKFHIRIGELAGEVADSAIFIGEMAPFYAEGFKSANKPYEIYPNVETFLERFTLEIKKGIILIKGSRALRMERITQKLLEEAG